jgi:hypothetical protein
MFRSPHNDAGNANKMLGVLRRGPFERDQDIPIAPLCFTN